MPSVISKVLPTRASYISIFAIISGLLALTLAYLASRGIMAHKPSMQNMNVLKKPLAVFSQKPMTGFYRDGYCRVGPDDKGNHAVAAVVSDEFLAFSASRGNDLRSIGLTGGCKWCLCTTRWKEALQARKSDDDPIVPRVFLHATADAALKDLDIKDLKMFAAEGEVANAGVAPRGVKDKVPVTPGSPGSS